METKLIMLEHTDPEFNHAFAAFPDKVMHNKVYGEVLQYMGTAVYTDGTMKHEFRHRAVPGTNERKYWKIEPSETFKARVRNGEYKMF